MIFIFKNKIIMDKNKLYEITFVFSVFILILFMLYKSVIEIYQLRWGGEKNGFY